MRDFNKGHQVFCRRRVLIEKLHEHLVLKSEILGFSVRLLEYADVLVRLVTMDIEQVEEVVKIVDLDGVLDKLEADGRVCLALGLR